ncbi:MAG: transketolase [Ancrocorticia sp.]|jgi:transketolase|nr:transketolase [Ancrocorticia sp.]
MPANTQESAELRLHAARARRNVLRMLEAHPAGHVGGAMSAIDIVTAIYFYGFRSINPEAPQRDRFLLSAGHKALAQYAVLAEAGVIPEEVLDTYGELNSHIPGHPDMHLLRGIEANTGALGHGLPLACGMASAQKMSASDARVFVLMGDGELPEGSNWEGAAMAAHRHLDNLVVFVDENGLQISGSTFDVMNMHPIAEKFRAFGWSAMHIDGNNMDHIVHALDACPLEPGKPTAIVARTTKGCGIREIAGTVASHYWKPTKEQLQSALEDADQDIRAMEAIS